MAAITLIGFVDNWTKNTPEHPDWAMRVTEPHRKKDGDQWVTTSRTNYTIKSAYDVDIDFTQFPVGARVEIVGKQLTETTEKDGKRYDNLIIKAETVTILDAPRNQAPAAAPTQVPAGWEPVSDSVPF